MFWINIAPSLLSPSFYVFRFSNPWWHICLDLSKKKILVSSADSLVVPSGCVASQRTSRNLNLFQIIGQWDVFHRRVGDKLQQRRKGWKMGWGGCLLTRDEWENNVFQYSWLTMLCFISICICILYTCSLWHRHLMIFLHILNECIENSILL